MALSFGPIFDKKYRVTRSYKDHPKFGCPGPDFATPMGTPLKAVFDGTVVSGVNPDIPGRIDPKEDWGKYIWLTYSKNKRIKVGYAHLSKFKVRSGKVKKGQIIAYSGNSGYSFGAHLHFAFSYYGKCIDPLNNPNVVRWIEEDEVTELESKVASFIYLYRAILNRHPDATMKKYFLYLAKKGTDPATWSRNKYLTPQIKKLKASCDTERKAFIKDSQKIANDLQTEYTKCRDRGVELSGELEAYTAEVVIINANYNILIDDLQSRVKDLNDEIEMFTQPKGVKMPRVSQNDNWWGRFWKPLFRGFFKRKWGDINGSIN